MWPTMAHFAEELYLVDIHSDLGRRYGGMSHKFIVSCTLRFNLQELTLDVCNLMVKIL